MQTESGATAGLPATTILAKGRGAADDGLTGWSLLAGELALPVATLQWSQLAQNLRWMADFARQSGALLAPHAKTAMTPALMTAQLAAGAWGLTVATIPQASVAIAAGARRVLLANPLVGAFEMRQVRQWLTAERAQDRSAPPLEFYCLIDDINQVEVLAAAFAGLRLFLLLELGVAGGRAGVRQPAAAVHLAQAVQRYPQLCLAGVHFYEGVVKGGVAAVAAFVRDCADCATMLQQAGLLQAVPSLGKPLLSGAGSAFYDVVTREAAVAGFQLVLRPGCYALHDSGIYQAAQQAVLSRSPLACSIAGELSDALLLWAYVLSRPEPELVVVGLGKRDAAFDAGLPQACYQFRPGGALPQPWPVQGYHSQKIMDQHVLLQVPADASLQVGDMLAFRTSHPCLTLDKWRTLAVLDDDFVIRQLLPTEF